jgi:signal transduction histidine kinase
MKEGKYVKLSIKDQGVGIAEDNLERVFDPYFSTKERGSQKGMGLGLTVAYSIFKKRGGHVSLESERGVGTVLHLYIPVSDQPRNQNKGTMGMLRAESQMRRQVL